MDGTFREVRTRTVPRQEKPYTPLVEVTKSQPIFSFKHTEGTLAGFWTPDYAQGIGVAGFHLHYIDDERSGADMFSTMLLKTVRSKFVKSSYAFSTSRNS